jgi:hypothetical protein
MLVSTTLTFRLTVVLFMKGSKYVNHTFYYIMRGIRFKSERIGLLIQILHFWNAYSPLLEWEYCRLEGLVFVRNSMHHFQSIGVVCCAQYRRYNLQ